MDDDIDSVELFGHRVGDRRAALDGCHIRRHEQLLMGHIVGSRLELVTEVETPQSRRRSLLASPNRSILRIAVSPLSGSCSRGFKLL
jgi:hypothetical protein